MTENILYALSACIRQGRKQLERDVANGTLSGTEVVALAALAKPWVPGVYDTTKPEDKLRQHEGVVYELWQSHDSTSNPQWTPDAVPALWRAYHTTNPARALPYAQVTGAHNVYNTDECIVWTDGLIYRAKRDAVDRGPDELSDAWELILEEDT